MQVICPTIQHSSAAPIGREPASRRTACCEEKSRGDTAVSGDPQTTLPPDPLSRTAVLGEALGFLSFDSWASTAIVGRRTAFRGGCEVKQPHVQIRGNRPSNLNQVGKIKSYVGNLESCSLRSAEDPDFSFQERGMSGLERTLGALRSKESTKSGEKDGCLACRTTGTVACNIRSESSIPSSLSEQVSLQDHKRVRDSKPIGPRL
jgi:hypothetical protein